jgi:iron(III) transport system ATP-binding protein
LVVPNTDAADGGATFAIRPEAITVETAPGPAGALKGTITKSSYVGTHMEYTIDTAAGALFATCMRVERPLAPGAAVALVLAPRGVLVLAGG